MTSQKRNGIGGREDSLDGKDLVEVLKMRHVENEVLETCCSTLDGMSFVVDGCIVRAS